MLMREDLATGIEKANMILFTKLKKIENRRGQSLTQSLNLEIGDK